MSTNRRMGEKAVYTHNGILFSLKKERNSDTYYMNLKNILSATSQAQKNKY